MILLPLLLLFTEDEIALMKPELIIQTMWYLERLTCPRAAHVFTREVGASAHCQMGGMSRAQAVIFDWLEEVCQHDRRKSQVEQAESQAPDFARLLQKYHGVDIARSMPQIAFI